MAEKIVINTKNGLKKRYKIRTSGYEKEGKEYRVSETTLPAEVVEREARKNNMKVNEFIENFGVEWTYNGFPGLHLRFIKNNEDEK